jgi:GNAT superfamily N-acetyltransferase
MPVSIVPFAAQHLASAADLLAARHQQDRAWAADLAQRYADPAATRAVLQNLLVHEGMGGLVALQGSRLVGFLLGAPFLLAPTDVFTMWVRPRAAQIPYDGHATDPSVGGTVSSRLYATLAEPWVAHGLVAHYLTSPAHQAARAPWLDLGFGQFAELGVRATHPPAEQDSRHPCRLEVRRAVAADEEMIQELMTELFRSFAAAPIFLPFLPETAAARHRYVAELLVDPACPHWLAFRDGHLVGFQIFVEPTSPHWQLAPLETPERCVYLHWAYIVPDRRSTGIGATFFAHTMQWAREAGYERCAVHFITASRAATFWRGLGFRPISHWLCRSVDDRRSWATGGA